MAQLNIIRPLKRQIGDAIQGLKDAEIFSKTIVLVTADHGGKGKGHGGATMAEIEDF